jgi:hypothetical protein
MNVHDREKRLFTKKIIILTLITNTTTKKIFQSSENIFFNSSKICLESE